MSVMTIMLAGGSGSRMNSSINKTLLPICGKSVIRRSVEAFSGHTDEMVIVCHPDILQDLKREVSSASLPFSVRFTDGGKSRQESMMNGLKALTIRDGDIILVHDAARCLVSEQIIKDVIRAVRQFGTGIPAIPAQSTFKVCDQAGVVQSTPHRANLFEVQTPQGFSATPFLDAVRKAGLDGFEGTDDASILEHAQIPVHIVPGEKKNLKITTQEDLAAATYYLKGAASQMRVGMGYDVHQLTEGRKLYLCGVEIPWDRGLLGHSDADVALHALMDAMLGACGLGDIGRHYPDTDSRFSGISSVLLLEQTNRLIQDAGFSVANADITIVAQKPKLMPYIAEMTRKVAETLGIPENAVNIKATTTEKLGFEGREEGISAYAVCTVQ